MSNILKKNESGFYTTYINNKTIDDEIIEGTYDYVNYSDFSADENLEDAIIYENLDKNRFPIYNTIDMIWHVDKYIMLTDSIHYFTSSDGITWTQRNLSVDYAHLKWQVGCSNGIDIILCSYNQAQTLYTTFIAKSTDGISWSYYEILYDYFTNIIKIVWTGNIYIALPGNSTKCVFSSVDGISWTHRFIPNGISETFKNRYMGK